MAVNKYDYSLTWQSKTGSRLDLAEKQHIEVSVPGQGGISPWKGTDSISLYTSHRPPDFRRSSSPDSQNTSTTSSSGSGTDSSSSSSAVSSSIVKSANSPPIIFGNLNPFGHESTSPSLSPTLSDCLSVKSFPDYYSKGQATSIYPSSRATRYVSGGKAITINTDLAQRRWSQRQGSVTILPTTDLSSRRSSVGSNLAWGALASPHKLAHSSSPTPSIAKSRPTQSSGTFRPSIPHSPDERVSPVASPFGIHAAAARSMIELSSPVAPIVRTKRTFGHCRIDSFGSLKEEELETASEYFDAGSESITPSPQLLQAPADIGFRSYPQPDFAPSTPPRGALSPSSIPHNAPQPDADFGGRFTNTSAGLPSPARAGFRFSNATPVSTPLAAASSPRAAISMTTARTLDFGSSMPTTPSAIGLLPASAEHSPSPRRSIVRMASAEMGESWGRSQSIRDRPVEYATWGTPGSMRPLGESGFDVSSVRLSSQDDHTDSPDSHNAPPQMWNDIAAPERVQPLGEVIALGEGLAGGPQRDSSGRRINMKKWRQNDPLAEAGGVGAGFGVEKGDGEGAEKGGSYRHRFSRSVANFFAPQETDSVSRDGPKASSAKRFATNFRSMSVANLLAKGDRTVATQNTTPPFHQSAGDRARQLFAVAADVDDDEDTPSSTGPEVPERSSSHKNQAYLRRRARLQPIDSAKSKLPYSHSMPALHEYNDHQRGSNEKVQTWLTTSPSSTPVPKTVNQGGIPLEPAFERVPPAVRMDKPITPSSGQSGSSWHNPPAALAVAPIDTAPKKSRPSWTGLFRKSMSFTGPSRAAPSVSAPGHSRTVSSSVLPDAKSAGSSAMERPARPARPASFGMLPSEKGLKPSLLYRLRNPSTTSLSKRGPTQLDKELPPIPTEALARSPGFGWLQSRGMRSSTTLVNAPSPTFSPKKQASMESTTRSSTPPSSQLASLAEVDDEDALPPIPRRYIEVNLDSAMFSVEELLCQVDDGVTQAMRPSTHPTGIARASSDSVTTVESVSTVRSGASYDVGSAAIGHVLAAPFISVDQVRKENGMTSGRLAFPAPPERQGDTTTQPVREELRTPRAAHRSR